MPWDGAALYVSDVRDTGSLGRPKRIAGGDGSAVFQPEWSPDGHLYFIWDKTGWGQLYRWTGAERARTWRPRRRTSAAAVGIRNALLRTAPRRAVRCRLLGARDAAFWRSATQRRTRSCSSRDSGAAARIDDPIAAGNGFAALVTAARNAGRHALGRDGARLAITNGGHGLIKPGFISRGDVSPFRRPRRRKPSTASTTRPANADFADRGALCRPPSSWRTAGPPA